MHVQEALGEPMKAHELTPDEGRAAAGAVAAKEGARR